MIAAPLDDRVELRALLGCGGMGEVHRAWDRLLERAVAVKFLRGFDPREAERIVLEARLQARVEHPHVVRVHEVGALGGRPCLVLQLVEGRSLEEVGRACSVEQRVELLRQAAEGLHAAHREGLVHRDVKPANVLVEEGGAAPRALVSDFGLARGDEGGLTRSGLPAGTVEYMAPEQLLGTVPADFRSDVYALGASLYALLAGHPPFRRGERGDDAETSLLRRILEEAPDPLPREVPVELRRVTAKAMEKSSAARYATAQAFAEDLARFQRGEPVQARPAPAVERAYRWTRRNRLATRAIAGAVAAVLVAVGSVIWQARRAGAEAVEAARVGALATSFEARVRTEWLAPPHDLRPALAALRPDVERLRRLSERGPVQGPASYALGKGLELLDELEGARAAYERAQAQGFRGPEVAEALGEVLGRLYQRERDRALETLGPGARAERLASLERELKDPALRHLAEGAAGGWRRAWLEARTALLEGDVDTARSRAAQVLVAAPERYEARLLQGEAWMLEAGLRSEAEQLTEALAALDRGEQALLGAAEWGRSDPRVQLELARLHLRRVELVARQGRDTRAFVSAAQAQVDRVAQLDPDAPAALLAQAALLVESERFAANDGRDEGLPRLERAATLARRAVALTPADVEARKLLMLALYRLGHFLLERGVQCQEPLDEGILLHAATVALAPSDPEVRDTGAALHLEKGRAQLEAGEDASATLRKAVEEADAAQRLYPTWSTRIRHQLPEALARSAHAEWLAGIDPRPTLARGLSEAEALYRGAGESFIASHRAVVALGNGALTLLDMGADASRFTSRALEIVGEARAAHRETPLLGFLRGQILVLEARRRALEGTDPLPAIAESRRLLAEAVRRMRSPSAATETLALLALAEGRWRVDLGRDPSTALAAAERGFRRVEAEVVTGMAGPLGRAGCALERARWSRRQGRGAAAAEATAGLAPVAEAVRRAGRDPHPRLLHARLLGLAGDLAGGRALLARVLAENPLAGGSHEAHAAAAELAAR